MSYEPGEIIDAVSIAVVRATCASAANANGVTDDLRRIFTTFVNVCDSHEQLRQEWIEARAIPQKP